MSVVRDLRADEVSVAVPIVARAFAADPALSYLLPDERDRDRVGPGSCRRESATRAGGAGRGAPTASKGSRCGGHPPPDRGLPGHGGALMAHTFDQADAAELPCYLETTHPRALAIHEAHGFEIVSDTNVPNSDLRVWTMCRAPRRRLILAA